jgi:tRNA pseudouridine(38-40) synthase
VGWRGIVCQYRLDDTHGSQIAMIWPLGVVCILLAQVSALLPIDKTWSVHGAARRNSLKRVVLSKCGPAYLQQLSEVDASMANNTPSTNCDKVVATEFVDPRHGKKLTTALIRVAYDGQHFSGWSCTNDQVDTNGLPSKPRFDSSIVAGSSSGRRRRKMSKLESSVVRSVQGEIRSNLAKLYGNINIARIVVEGCSRTDKGVHAFGMVAQVYCVTEAAYMELHRSTSDAGSDSDDTPIQYEGRQQPSIPGKRMPHPWNASDDTCFVPLPKLALADLVSALNRMMSPDVQIMAVASVPTLCHAPHPFHPALSARSKTYRYTFSVGPRHDPIVRRSVWHVWDCGDETSWDDSLMREATAMLCGRHDFAAFQGAPRGPEDKTKRIHETTVCTIDSVNVRVASTHDRTVTYILEISGDRFLYKMARFLTGALVAVGLRKLTLSHIEQLLTSTTRQSVPEFECAPAHGLSLQFVRYDDPIDWQTAAS